MTDRVTLVTFFTRLAYSLSNVTRISRLREFSKIALRLEVDGSYSSAEVTLSFQFLAPFARLLPRSRERMQIYAARYLVG